MSNIVVIVAGGSGTRMGSVLPKQFLELEGKPILMHTIEQFTRFDKTMTIILCLPQAYHEMWKTLCVKHQFDQPLKLVIGGATRFQTVANALSQIGDVDNETLIAVHDGVRPFVSVELLDRCFTAATEHQAVVPYVLPIESLREVFQKDGVEQNKAVRRADYRVVQTPQIFNASILKQAYQQSYHDGFTDDASVVEACGQAIYLVEGCVHNIKITQALDLVIAQWILKLIRNT